MKIIIKTIYFSVILFLLLTNLLSASVGTSEGQFLKYSPSVRSSSIADTTGSLIEEIDNIFYNPAGTYSKNMVETSTAYTKGFQDMNYLSAAGQIKLANTGNIAIGFVTLMYADDLFKVTENNGLLESSNEKISPGNYLFLLNYCKQLIKNLYGGINLRIATEILMEADTQAGIDFGGIYQINKKISVGMSMMGIGIKNSDSIIKINGSYKILQLTKNDFEILLLSGIDNMGDSGAKAGMGIEGSLLKTGFVRVGYKFGDELGGFRLGLGIKYNMLKFDYGFSMFGTLGNMHRFGLKFSI